MSIVDNLKETFEQSKQDVPIIIRSVNRLSLSNKIGHKSKIELYTEDEVIQRIFLFFYFLIY